MECRISNTNYAERVPIDYRILRMDNWYRMWIMLVCRSQDIPTHYTQDHSVIHAETRFVPNLAAKRRPVLPIGK